MLRGKRALVTGFANQKSIAWSVLKEWHAQGAIIAVSIKDDRFRPKAERLLRDLAGDSGTANTSPVILKCDFEDDRDVQTLSRDLADWSQGTVDAALHAMAFAPSSAFQKDFASITRDEFLQAHNISAYSLIALARVAAPLMKTQGGSIVALTYLGSQKVVPNYSIMGPSKASLEATARYLASDLGRMNIRVNCLSAGPINTLSARGIPEFKNMLDDAAKTSPIPGALDVGEVAKTATFLASDFSRSITGQTIFGRCLHLEVTALPQLTIYSYFMHPEIHASVDNGLNIMGSTQENRTRTTE